MPHLPRRGCSRPTGRGEPVGLDSDARRKPQTGSGVRILWAGPVSATAESAP